MPGKATDEELTRIQLMAKGDSSPRDSVLLTGHRDFTENKQRSA
jgi:hypothetical protein